MCAGLGCLVEYNPLQEAEHNKTGTCVTEQGASCKNVKSGVSCRPGQIGVPSDFVFCPAPIVATSSDGCKNNGTKSQHSNRVASASSGTGGSQGFLFSGSAQGSNQNRNNRPIRPPGTIGETIRNIVSSVPSLGVPQAVHDVIQGR